MPGLRWRALFAEDRHLLQVVAVDAAMRGGDTPFVLESAAVLLGLPLFRIHPTRVHVAGPHVDGWARPDADSGHPRAMIARHEISLPGADRVVIDGIVCTTLERTVFDMLRCSAREAGMVILCSALRAVAWDAKTRTYDVRIAEKWRAGLVHRIQRSAGARGIRQARRLAPLGDGRTESPGESVSLLYIDDLGFARPRLQVPVPGPHGSVYSVDFGLDDVDAWGEFDGRAKYLDPQVGGHADPGAAVLAEKERQDWIHGTTGRRFVRWGSEHIASADVLGRRLTQFGIRPIRAVR